MRSPWPQPSACTRCGRRSTRIPPFASPSSPLPIAACSAPAWTSREAAQLRRERGVDILQTLSDPFYERMRAVRKPLIAALNGHFTAAGMVLAINADLRVGLAGTRAGITEVRVGRGTPWAVPMLWMLPQAMLHGARAHGRDAAGRAAARGRLLQLPRADGGRGARACTGAGKCRSARTRRCASMRPRKACGSGQHWARAPGSRPRSACTKRCTRARMRSEGPRAFAEKRKPVWRGR